MNVRPHNFFLNVYRFATYFHTFGQTCINIFKKFWKILQLKKIRNKVIVEVKGPENENNIIKTL